MTQQHDTQREEARVLKEDIMTKREATILCNQYQIDTTKEFYTLSSTEIGRVWDAAAQYYHLPPSATLTLQLSDARFYFARYFFGALRRVIECK